MAPIGLKLCQNPFQTNPHILFSDVEKHFESLDFFGLEDMFFSILVRFLRSNDQTDVKIEFYAKRYAYRRILKSVRLKIAKICPSIKGLRVY